MYKFRYFFDGVTGTCLWSANERANAKFDYPVFLEDLPLTAYVLELANAVLQQWTNFPFSETSWPNARARVKFRRDAQRFLALLRENLGADFLIHDESATASGASKNL